MAKDPLEDAKIGGDGADVTPKATPPRPAAPLPPPPDGIPVRRKDDPAAYIVVQDRFRLPGGDSPAKGSVLRFQQYVHVWEYLRAAAARGAVEPFAG